MNPVPPPLSERIQRRINALDAGGAGAWRQRACRGTHNALPLNGNPLTQWALRPDGVVLRIDCDSVLLAAEEEADPLARYAVLHQAARLDPELAALVPERPPGVVRCEHCGGAGCAAETGESCGGCQGLGWHVERRPVEEWLAGIDRGDQLRLRSDGDTRGIFAARLAGCYFAHAEELPSWSAPDGARGRRQLDEHLRRYGYEHRFGRQKHVTATWQPNATDAADPLESLSHALRWSGTGAGGSYEVELARQPGGGYRLREMLNNDWEPLGSGPPSTRTTELDQAAARAEVLQRMRGSGASNPFPAIVPRTDG
jgi:hypothetical protein